MTCELGICKALSSNRYIECGLPNGGRQVLVVGSDVNSIKPAVHETVVHGCKIKLLNTAPIDSMAEPVFVLAKSVFYKSEPPEYLLFMAVIDHNLSHEVARIAVNQKPLAKIINTGSRIFLTPMDLRSIGIYHDRFIDRSLSLPDEFIRDGEFRQIELQEGASIRLCGENSALGQLVIHDNNTAAGSLIAA